MDKCGVKGTDASRWLEYEYYCWLMAKQTADNSSMNKQTVKARNGHCWLA